MGKTRFRKSVKVAPGVSVNFNKKSVGMTVGPKGAKYTVNSSGRKTATVGIPGTGLYYSESSGGGTNKRSTTSTYAIGIDSSSGSFSTPKSDLEKAVSRLAGNKRWFIFQFILTALALLGNAYIPALLFVGIALYLHKVRGPKLQAAKNKEEEAALGLQELLLGDPSASLVLQPAELMSRAREEFNCTLSAVGAAFESMDKAKEPVSFFGSYDSAVENAGRLSRFEPYLSFIDTKPSELVAALDSDKDELIMDFLKKYFDDTKTKAASLVTEKGRNGRFQRYYDSLVPYFECMSQECVDYVEKTYSDNFIK